MRLSVIIPYQRNRDALAECLSAVAAASAHVARHECLVVADGCPDLGGLSVPGARVLPMPGPRGPAAARNHGAAVATGDLLVFVDADVCVHEDALARLARLFEEAPEIAAAFGSYDDHPTDRGFVSQGKNLTHSFFHRQANPEAFTFWAGIGAVRADAFAAVGGFDERFSRPSAEDIDLGYRLRAAGYRIRVDPSVQGTHLKRWTMWASVVSDIRDRGVPWTQIIQRDGLVHDDLNLRIESRACLGLAVLAVACAVAGVWTRPALAGVAPCAIGIWWLESPLHAFLAARRGWPFAFRWFGCRVIHHLGNAVAYAAGSGLRLLRRGLQVDLPGALPLEPWASPREHARRGTACNTAAK